MKPNSHQPRSLAVITGATGGVGLEIAKGLARAGYDIILGARSERRGTEAVTAIRSVATDPASIQQSPLDLASLASVAAFASALPDRPIDRLVLNAGVMLTNRKETKDGFEMMFGTNVLGHFALVSHVLDRVLAAHGPRVITQSSESHRAGHLNLQDLQHTADFSPLVAYNDSNKHNTYWPWNWTADTRTPAASSASQVGSSPISAEICPMPTCCSAARTRLAPSSSTKPPRRGHARHSWPRLTTSSQAHLAAPTSLPASFAISAASPSSPRPHRWSLTPRSPKNYGNTPPRSPNNTANDHRFPTDCLFAPEFAVIVANQSVIGESRHDTANIEGVDPVDELNDGG